MTDYEMDARWLRLWTSLGASHTQALMDWRDLVAHYAVPERVYHSFEHVLDCQREFDSCRPMAADPLVLEAAIWYHDVVYDPRSSDNEQASANMAHAVLLRAGMPLVRVEEVERLILATRHATIPEKGDAALLVDIDLAILGSPDETFDRYEEGVRAEYAWVPEALFRGKRAELLEGFLARPTLFTTEVFRERLETQARANLARSIARLRRE